MTTVTEMLAFRVRRLVRIRAEVWRCGELAERRAIDAAMDTLAAGHSVALVLMDAYKLLAAARGDLREMQT